jgi:branched-chain amino acid transport system substrate-binding protein
LPRPSWASALLAALALVGCAGCAGCGGSGSEPDADAVLRVYVSLPMHGPLADDARDAADGARLALADAGGEAGGVTVEAKYLDDATSAGWTPAQVGVNARTATQDSTAIAYLGDFESGATRTSLPITNTAGMLQVSPASGATDLVDEFPGSDQISELQTTGKRTFGRVIPGDEAQARAAAGWVDDMGVRTVSVVRDDTDFSKDMADTFRDSLTRATISRSPELLFFTDQVGQTPSLAKSFDGTQMVTDAGLTPERIATSTPGLLATSAALDPSQLPPAGQEFVKRFRDEYGREPGRYGAYGYEAMALILASIDRASDPTDRSAVIKAFFDTADRDSILGTYSIADNGETTLDRMTGYEINGGAIKPVAEIGGP